MSDPLTGDLSSDPWDPKRKPDIMVCACHPSAGEAKTGGCWELAGQPVLPVSELQVR